MLINIVTSVVLWGIAAICVLRVLGKGGLKLPNHPAIKWLMRNSVTYQAHKPDKKEYAVVALEAFLFRALGYLAAALALRIFLEDNVLLTFKEYISQWLKWDANSYVNIAKGGYTSYMENGEPIMLVFFPLYSIVIRMVHVVIKDFGVAAMAVSSLCFIAGSCYFYGLVSMEYGKSIARKAVFYISIFPFAFFFGGMMTESIFFLTVSACLYYIRRHDWTMVAFTGILSGLCRMQGVLLMIPAAVEWFVYYKPVAMIRWKKWKQLWYVFYSKALLIATMVIGPLIYLYYNFKITGNPFKFMEYQETIWNHGPVYIGKAVVSMFGQAFTKDPIGIMRASIGIPQVFIFLLAVALMIYAIRKHADRYILYLLAYTIVNYSLSWVISASRYMLVAVPMFIFLAALAEKHKWLDKWITVISLMFYGIYLTGFLMWRQIM